MRCRIDTHLHCFNFHYVTFHYLICMIFTLENNICKISFCKLIKEDHEIARASFFEIWPEFPALDEYESFKSCYLEIDEIIYVD